MVAAFSVDGEITSHQPHEPTAKALHARHDPVAFASSWASNETAADIAAGRGVRMPDAVCKRRRLARRRVLPIVDVGKPWGFGRRENNSWNDRGVDRLCGRPRLQPVTLT